MFAIDCSPDPHMHSVCSRIANRVVFAIRPLLRNAEARDIALREAYAIAREEFERHGSAAGGGTITSLPRRRPGLEAAATAVSPGVPCNLTQGAMAMVESIVAFLILLPFVSMVWEFYYRLGVWLWLTLRPAIARTGPGGHGHGG